MSESPDVEWCSDALAFDGSFDSLKLSCRCPQQNFARPSGKDSRLWTAKSPGRGYLLAGVLDSWASSGLLSLGDRTGVHHLEDECL